ncbi:Fur family transcriptional regulator [Aestuariibius sp. HNIBRBA575]|uniref:Fur family transcriptional regulator n=1 Tax=Aestuariibius sp. HNIBRBA575 TaxID=3233343 RepID=UPI0034A527B9
MTAYAILSELKSGEPDLAAPTIYRALSALTEQGRAHKLESISAFVACRCQHHKSVPVLEICSKCGTAQEHDGASLLPELTAISAKSNFQTTRHIVEIHGFCHGCSHS